jgi:hypothetical protein
MLALSPEERLGENDRMVRTIEELRHATSLGQLDVLGAIEGGRGYEELARESITVEVEGRPVRVVRLEILADLKRGATSAKDRLTLALLEETLRRRGGG